MAWGEMAWNYVYNLNYGTDWLSEIVTTREAIASTNGNWTKGHVCVQFRLPSTVISAWWPAVRAHFIRKWFACRGSRYYPITSAWPFVVSQNSDLTKVLELYAFIIQPNDDNFPDEWNILVLLCPNHTFTLIRRLISCLAWDANNTDGII